jgi:hypothetical protein
MPFVPFVLTIENTRGAKAADDQLVNILPGENVDVFFEINLSGHVVARIQTRTGPGCAEFWWVVWPFGYVRQVGRHCGQAEFQIPGLFDFSISAKL